MKGGVTVYGLGKCDASLLWSGNAAKLELGLEDGVGWSIL
jgi:hypothetical protein